MAFMEKTVFNKPYIIGKELEFIRQAVINGHLSGDGPFSKKCHQYLEKHLRAKKVLLTHSCTAALEMAAMLCDIQPGDEVIMPSYTFVSTANAFVLRGGVPVFCDIRTDTKNIDESKIESLITSKTKAIVPVHYAGIACDMDAIIALAGKYKLLVVEDAAQAVNAVYKGKFLGTIGDLGCYSFHETKNFISGEGGAIAVNNRKFIDRAEIIREKGTNRTKYFQGQVDKYTWIDIGSSFLPSELTAAFLYAQLQEADKITAKRLLLWNTYHQELLELEENGLLARPVIPEYCVHNAHMYHIVLNDLPIRTALIEFLGKHDIMSVFHYVPLHSSPAGRHFARSAGELPVTDYIADRLLRLPCYYELEPAQVIRITGLIKKFFHL